MNTVPQSIPKYHLDGIFRPTGANKHDAHSIVVSLVPENTRVLELGCSSGYLSGYLEREKGCHVTGVDFDPVATAIAKERCSKVYTLDLDQPETLNQVEGKFDVLLAPAVLEHLKYPARILEIAKTKLTPHATVIVTLPNIAHWSVRLNLLRGRFDYTDYGVMDRTHVHFYAVRTARELLEQQGFHIQRLYIAGSFVQNILNRITALIGMNPPAPILPGLLGYELIYLATC